MMEPNEKLMRKMEELDEFFYDELLNQIDELLQNPTPANYERFVLIMKADHKVDCFLEKWRKRNSPTMHNVMQTQIK